MAFFFKKFLFCLPLLRDSKEPKMRAHRLPLPDTACDCIIAVALAFLNLDWVYIESCQWPLGVLVFSYTQRLHE